MTIAIGLTGAFGSGCTTAAKHLRDNRGFTVLRLSEPIRSKWQELHPGEAEKRPDLQQLGDQMRQESGGGVLIDLALGSLGDNVSEKLVIDGIRNTDEVERLRDEFGYSFTLIGVLASSTTRWERISASAYTDHGLTEDDFHRDDTKDRNEETPWGQQVELCIDKADVFIDNSDEVHPRTFKKELLNTVDLVAGTTPRSATPDEICMHIAYGASHGSKCIKRHVGAIVVDSDGEVVGLGYNENPAGTKPCVEEPEYGNKCYRDIIRNGHFQHLSERQMRCPQCSTTLPVIVGPPWHCPNCTNNRQKTNLEAFFFPDRAMNWCTAIHAEAAALAAAGRRSRGGTVYTTTFPCMQCAEKIIQAGIVRVCYTEAYPDNHSIGRLAIGKVRMDRFRGVRSSSFERIFGPIKPA